MEHLTVLGPGDNQADWVGFTYSPSPPAQPSDNLGNSVSDSCSSSLQSSDPETTTDISSRDHVKFQMSSAAVAPDPSLIAILLVIQDRTGSGARLIFHYPPDPLNNDDAELKSIFSSLDIYESSSTSSEESPSSAEDDTPTPRKTETRSRDGTGTKSWNSVIDEEEDTSPTKIGSGYGDKVWEPAWEPLLGLGTDGLVALLTPDRSWHKRRFDVGINDFCFLGWPVFAREDGTWRKQKKRSAKPKPAQETQHDTEADALASEVESSDNKSSPKRSSSDNTPQRKPEKSGLTMFNLVFVLDPPILEQNVRVKEMYEHVVKKFIKALKWEQGRSEYIWKEAELIQSIESKHFAEHSPSSAIYTELLARSSLATAISTVFTSISTSRIASITLSPSTAISLQIPPVTSISVLPSLNDPPAPAGLWLTTVNDLPEPTDIDSLSHENPLQLAKKFTLLLKSSKSRILKDIQSAGGPLALPLSTFVLATNPTKSFHKISLASKISLTDIQLLARHLIYWRRAVAIPPLNQRDTYVVSPNADMSKLKAASKAYETAFPNLPSLPLMLSKLSETPKPWGFLSPSTDHKEAYYDVLAWLMRGGWVMQLRTFAYIRVDPEVKKAVREQEAEQQKVERTRVTGPGVEDSTDGAQASRRPSIVSRRSSEARFSSTSTTNSSNHLASATGKPDNPNVSTMIMNPLRASPLESAWLEHIADSLLTTDHSLHTLSDEEKQELRSYWPVFVKYFNGQDALEDIPVREGMKRKLVWEILGKMGLDFDHGVEKEGGNKSWLVTIRHW